MSHHKCCPHFASDIRRVPKQSFTTGIGRADLCLACTCPRSQVPGGSALLRVSRPREQELQLEQRGSASSLVERPKSSAEGGHLAVVPSSDPPTAESHSPAPSPSLPSILLVQWKPHCQVQSSVEHCDGTPQFRGRTCAEVIVTRKTLTNAHTAATLCVAEHAGATADGAGPSISAASLTLTIHLASDRFRMLTRPVLHLLAPGTVTP